MFPFVTTMGERREAIQQVMALNLYRYRRFSLNTAKGVLSLEEENYRPSKIPERDLVGPQKTVPIIILAVPLSFAQEDHYVWFRLFFRPSRGLESH